MWLWAGRCRGCDAAGVQGDGNAQNFRDRAQGTCLLGEFGELFVGDAGQVGGDDEVDALHRVAVAVSALVVVPMVSSAVVVMDSTVTPALKAMLASAWL
ncbi:MAG: hypothetical protein QOI79_4436 [Mycobacterium sp.]|nr:hypothetical protein [Mycobacterium sp.]